MGRAATGRGIRTKWEMPLALGVAQASDSIKCSLYGANLAMRAWPSPGDVGRDVIIRFPRCEAAGPRLARLAWPAPRRLGRSAPQRLPRWVQPAPAAKEHVKAGLVRYSHDGTDGVVNGGEAQEAHCAADAPDDERRESILLIKLFLNKDPAEPMDKSEERFQSRHAKAGLRRRYVTAPRAHL